MRLYLALFALLAVGCTNGSGGYSAPNVGPAPTPTRPPVTQHAYVVDGTTHAVLIYALPLSATSKPIGQIPIPPQGGTDCSDSQGRLFVTDDSGFAGGPIYAFTQPITPSSKPAFTIGSAAAVSCTFDSAGNLYVGSVGQLDQGRLYAYAAPVGAGSSPIFNYGIGEPRGITTNSAGDVFVNSENFTIYEFSPRASGNMLIARFGYSDGHSYYLGIALGPDGNLYAARNGTPTGIDVYPPSAFHDYGVKDHTIGLGSATPGYISFDDSGNLLVTVNGSAIYAFAPPYTSPNVITPTSNGSFGIAVAP